MAKKQQSAETSNYTKGLNEDSSNLYQDTSSWTHARNAVNNTERGDIGYLGNEPSNKECIQAPYTIIGFIHLEADEWAIFSTDDTNSEIGFFKEGLCSYRTIVNAPCLNLKRTNLISGVSKTNATCGKVIYWSDNLNPDRYLNIDDVPWIKTQITDPQGCITYQNTNQLDCDKIRLESFVQQPCVRLEKGNGSGTLLNGSYFVVIGYTVNEQRVTDYSMPSNIIALFDNDNVAGSLKINFDSLDTTNYEEFELVIVSTTSARRVGYYSTRTQSLDIDLINNSWPSVPIEILPIRNTVYEKSEAMYKINNYLLRVAPESKFSFNYQPIANQIQTKWVSVEYDQTYYRNSGTNVGYMRDETYAFFIRWVYATGDRSVSYHIPGRVKNINDINLAGATSLPSDGTGPFERWQLANTAVVTSFPNTLLQDGGIVVAEGDMGYWESSEKYPDDNPEVWNADIVGQPQFDLCNQHIRHHKFPDNFLHSTTSHFNNDKIRIMGVKFDNIQPPLDLNGQPIPGIVGYEILRGSRDGQKTILAKGIINNMFGYNVINKLTNRTGFYPNYPFNDLRPDPFISSVNHITTSVNPINNSAVSRNRLTFHSPETTFNNPFLSTKELKLYGAISGTGLSKVQHPEDHPSHKLITNLTFILSIFIGVGNALANARGKRKISYTPGYASNFGAPTVDLSSTFQTASATALNSLNVARYYGFISTNALSAASELAVIGGLGAAQLADTAQAGIIDSPVSIASIAPGTVGFQVFQESEETDFSTLSIISKFVAGFQMSYAFIGQGSDAFIDLILALSPFRNYALQRIAYAQYSNHHQYTTPLKHRRHEISHAAYLKNHIHDFGNNDVINNINRSRTVALQTTSNIDNPQSISTAPQDTSRVLNHPSTGIHTVVQDSIKTSFNTSVHYAALKNRLVNQYGQLEGVIQLPVTTCVIDKSETTSPPLFNGDTYIGRFTEKNTFHYFYDWLFKQPDGTEYNYKDFQNVPYPMYYADLSDYDFSDFTSSLTNIFSAGSSPLDLPSDRHNLHSSGFGGLFTRKNSYFYLFNSGVRDFFVESEYNIDFRIYGDKEEERHYDYQSYQDLETIFRTKNIKAGNYAKFDISVNISRLYSNAVPWGSTHVRNYNPTLYESCYTKWEKRVLYSLSSFTEKRKDHWLIFLTNSNKDFNSRVTSIKPIGKSGAMFFFETESPIQVQGVDTLQTDTGVKLTIGDGKLFTQPLQNIVNTDAPYEYGSCQNRLAPINTSSGLFWISQNQGKIFMYAGGLKEVSGQNLKWWLSDFLPYRLTQAFPNYDLLDNPVVGIGCQSAYDNTNNVVYFSKKDYVLRDDVDATRITYIGNGLFSYAGQFTFETGDTRFFIDASWTISLDAKSGEWISYHDWFPDLTMATKDHFLTTKRNGLWKHNEEFDSYCNFYGFDYPFEIEYILSTGQQVNTLRSVEYFLEVYKYAQNGIDRFHVLDFNFDEAVIHNSEQCSGVLRLNLKPKNDILSSIQYPIINTNSIDILYSKEEHKYRFNQFWDITDDRGEFNINAQRHIWDTEPNGFRKSLNFNNLNYAKNEFERKKFRHYSTAVLLKRNVSGDRKMLVLLTNNKSQASPR